MYLKQLTLKGFKSFPGRTRLQFSPGVSVIVGPNGCGKSNITDAVLWALGEQSPLAVRGQTMQDVIFAGGPGQGPRRYAEVEVVIDNSEGRSASEFSEIAISRRLERSGDGEYRLNGARCRLVDVLEVLADTNMGREMHSVISQGRVEQVVSSKPRDRRMLIEEAAGLGKHRKRRRRAELRLERTRENLDRALDVEREARSRLRPLKLQAEAADLRARLERQELELRAELGADRLRAEAAALAEAERAAAAARQERDAVEERLTEVAKRRERAEQRIGAREGERRALGDRLIEARSVKAELGVRRDALAATARELEGELENRRAMLAALEESADPHAGASVERIAELEAELEEVERSLASRAEGALGELSGVAKRARERHTELEAEHAPLRDAAGEAERELAAATAARERAEAETETAKRRLAGLRGELEAVEARLAAASGGEATRTLASVIQAAPGMEQALTAVLGERLRAEVVDDLEAGAEWLAASEDPGRALVRSAGRATKHGEPPSADARPLLELVEADEGVAELAERLLGDAWLVEELTGIRDDFEGIAVTIEGHVLDAGPGELRRLPRGATDPALTARSEREELVHRVAERERTAERASAVFAQANEAAERARERHETAARALRDATRALEEAKEDASRKEWLLGQRRQSSEEQGPEAVRRAQVEAELAAERRHAEAAERTRAESERRREALRERVARAMETAPRLGSLAEALGEAEAAIEKRIAALEASAREDAEGDAEDPAAELRACSAQEAELQGELRGVAERVTRAEVESAQARDRHDDAAGELKEIAAGLDRELSAAERPLTEFEEEEIDRKLGRLANRREKIGPVNPLAQREYEEARTRLDELRTEREDLEAALTELRKLIREIDREIERAFDVTFQATAENFEEMVTHLFPGGRGQLRIVDEGPHEAEVPADEETESDQDEEGDEGDEELAPADLSGVEIEASPAGKATKRLSLLSGGEKSLVALAFVFAVFLARPCPFYILDEVEAALDDANIDRFLQLVRRFSDRSQFVIVTHQKRTMDAADVLYGVSMGTDGVTKIVSKRLPREEPEGEPAAEAQAA